MLFPDLLTNILQNPEWRTRLKKDPGIPNLFPYKAKVLEEIEEARRRKEEDAVRRREIAKAQRLGTTVDQANAVIAEGAEAEDDELLDLADEDEDAEPMDEDDSNPMAALLASARARAAEYEGDSEEDEMEEDGSGEEWSGIRDGNGTE